ncbi:hypothetical protein TWF225_004464 [Orbilia oligospora]|uniref:tyrosinase n=1 Tax=Orbilia oligospora TaxID=2813651 RepID=A0A7C8PHR6_ORBOL|nr:hypothetical protein TWF751_005555 [Orbilia oligospora]KAF3186841.1 hypothetical protein TWF225_004464 [Orbilia oligospora]KAF3243493.1 hypothetical protein TWF128_010212 [Orbilia oligospora]KAF3250202.1 hypothetical protein TWF217_008672 [Orbilia oligospora]KAF3288850.1 hypothetical protein TWF132_007892 [Orbilia oligospora]
MVSCNWATSALLALLSVSSAGVHAAPQNYKPNPDPVNEKRQKLQTLVSDLVPVTRVPVTFVTINTARTLEPTFTRVPTLNTNTLLTLGTLSATRIPVTLQTLQTTTSSTLPVYTPPTTPPYGYTPPGTTTTSSSSRTTTSSSRTSSSATPTYTPVTGANNTCYNRLKIDVLQRTDPDQFNMLLLAWQKIQTSPDSDPFSHYQLSGIHGAPFIPWQMGPGSYDYSRGYCTHGSALFTTWHRPYLLALEQALFHAAHAIANQFAPAAIRTQYLNAAGRVRLPYWDWSDPVTQSYLPPITMQQTVTVTRPDGSGNPVSASISNPIFAYNFLSSSSISVFGAPWNSRLSTRRYPDASWNDRSNLASSAMQSGFSTRVTNTYNAFLSTTYNVFSNRVEGVHDSIHGAVGGGGHMSYVAYSAFDPIFWLHHCNVDRLMAMFQATSPGLFVTPASAVGTFARPVPPNTIDDANTDLFPFRRADGSWYKSSHLNPVSTIWGMRYGYPEVPCSYQTRTPAELDTFTTNQVNTLYGNGRTIPGTSREWNVRLLIDQAEIPGGYDIYVYGGTRPQDPYADPYGKGYIGSLSSMSMGSVDQYKQSRIRFVDISLNSYLKEYGYGQADPYKITDYIRRDLTYTIIANGKPCYFQDLYTARYAVYSRDVYDSGKSDVLPYYTSDPYYHTNVTEGYPGGIKYLDEILYPVKVDGTREVPWAENNSTRIQT